MRVDVVSAEESIFSGEAKFVALPGEVGNSAFCRAITRLSAVIRARFGANRKWPMAPKNSCLSLAAFLRCSPMA